MPTLVLYAPRRGRPFIPEKRFWVPPVVPTIDPDLSDLVGILPGLPYAPPFRGARRAGCAPLNVPPIKKLMLAASAARLERLGLRTQ